MLSSGKERERNVIELRKEFLEAGTLTPLVMTSSKFFNCAESQLYWGHNNDTCFIEAVRQAMEGAEAGVPRPVCCSLPGWVVPKHDHGLLPQAPVIL